MKYFVFIIVLIFLGLAGCKKVPNLAINELDPKFPNYRPSPPNNLVTFKNYDNNSVGIAWKSTINQPISGYIISASKTGESDSYKKAFIIDSNQVNPDNIYQIFTPLLYKSTQEYYKTEAFYAMENDTAFSDPIYSAISQYVFDFHYDFTPDSTPDFQLYWQHSFITSASLEVQISTDSLDFKTIYNGPIENRFFTTKINTTPDDVFFRIRMKTENETTQFYPINLNSTDCFEYYGDTFLFIPQTISVAYNFAENKITYAFDNTNCKADEIILLEGGYHPDRPITEITRFSNEETKIEVTNLQQGIKYYFWLVAKTDDGMSTLTKATRVLF